MCVPDSREDVLDARRLVAWLDAAEVQLVHAVPSLFRTLLAEPLAADQFAALRHVLLAGEPVLPSDVQRWTEVFGERIQLVNLYGPTETTMVKLFYRIRPEDALRRSVPIGRAMPGARALVLDDHGRPAPLGAIGEIYVRTEFRTLGYYDDPALTAQVFVPNPLGRDPDDIVYRTGDLGRMLDDGNIEFLGRKDQQVKIRGVRVELGEIDSALLATGMVSEAAAVARTDRLGNAYLCAYVVPAGDGSVEQLRQAVAAMLPDMLVPSTYVRLERMPRTSTGKIDRKALPAPEAARASGVAPIAPRTAMEAEVAALFAGVLGLEQVGVNEEFFQLGGHSLLAMGLISRLSDRFDVEVPLAALFEFSTVEQITRYIEDRGGGAAEPEPLRPARAPALGGVEHRVGELSEAAVDSLLSDVLGVKVS
jgi:acyl-coenzyme A synthetase/AMP-(fatty) acid ligase/acyl carrier protein